MRDARQRVGRGILAERKKADADKGSKRQQEKQGFGQAFHHEYLANKNDLSVSLRHRAAYH